MEEPYGCLNLGLHTADNYALPIDSYRIIFDNEKKLARVLGHIVDEDGRQSYDCHYFASIDEDFEDEAEMQSKIDLGDFLKSNLYKYTSSNARSIVVPPMKQNHAFADSAKAYYSSGNQINEGLERIAVHQKNFRLLQQIRDNMPRTLEESEDGWIFGMDNKRLLIIDTTYSGISVNLLQGRDDGA